MISNKSLFISMIVLFQVGLSGCVPLHDVMIVNCSDTTYQVEILDRHGDSRAKISVTANSVARIKGAVSKPGQNDKFLFRFESKEKKKEIKQSWEELSAREWIVPICD